jgi:predicted nucleic acid-binding protein
MPQIADTGFLVAYWNKGDTHHQWARGVAVRSPLLTCEAVVTEAAYLLDQAVPLLEMFIEGDMTAEFEAELHAAELKQWLEKFEDLNPGFADACVVRLAEITQRAEILTTDRRDFSIYRTLAGKPLRCSFPPS